MRSRQKVGVSGHPSFLPRFFFHLTGFSQKVGWGIGSDQVKYLGFLGVWASSRITVVTHYIPPMTYLRVVGTLGKLIFS